MSEDWEELDWETEFAYEELSKAELDKFLKSLKAYYKKQITAEQFSENLGIYLENIKELPKGKYYDKEDVEKLLEVYNTLRFYHDPSDTLYKDLERARQLTKDYLESLGYTDLDSKIQLSLDDKEGMYQKARQDVLAEMTNKIVKKEYEEMKEDAKKDILIEAVSGKPIPQRDYRDFNTKFAEALEGAVKDIQGELKYRKLLQGASTDPNYQKDRGFTPETQLRLEQLSLEQETKRKEAVDTFLQAWKQEKQKEEELYQKYKKQRNL